MAHYIVPGGSEHTFIRPPASISRSEQAPVSTHSRSKDDHSSQQMMLKTKKDLDPQREPKRLDSKAERSGAANGLIEQIMFRPGQAQAKERIIQERDKTKADIKEKIEQIVALAQLHGEKLREKGATGKTGKKETEKPAAEFMFASTDIRYRDLGAKPKTQRVKADQGHPPQSDHAKDFVDKEMPAQNEPLVPLVVPGAESLIVKADEEHIHLAIPTVVVTPRHPLRGGDSDKLANLIKRYLWPAVDRPPVQTFPQHVLYFAKEGDEFGKAIEDLLNQKRIGLNAIRVKRNRVWRITHFICSTKKKIYIFDFDKFGLNLFSWGLYDVLVDPDREFVTHNIDVILDMLEEDYGIEISDIFDTLAAYAVVVPFLMDKRIETNVSLRTLARELLGVESAHLPPPHPQEADSMAEFIMNCARDTMYLLPLYNEFLEAFELKAKLVCKALMRDTLETELEEAEEIFLSPECVPREVSKKCFPLHQLN